MTEFYGAILGGSVAILLSLLFAKRKVATNPPAETRVPATPALTMRQTTEQFLARIMKESEDRDPANWWKRGEEPPTEFSGRA